MRTIINSDRGIAMVVVVVIMVVLLTMTGAGLILGGLNLKATSNLKTGGAALQVADGGIQHALAVISSHGGDFDSFLAGSDSDFPCKDQYGTPGTCNGATFKPTLTGSLNDYSYTVVAENDTTVAGETTTDDVNRIITLMSTATGPNGSTRRIKAHIRSRSLGDIPGAITVIDSTGADPFGASFQGNNFLVQGQDTMMPSASDPANIPAGCSATPTSENKLGISLSSLASVSETAEEALSGTQIDNIKGLLPGGELTNTYTEELSFGYNNGPGQSYNITANDLQQFMDELRPQATTLPTGNYSGDLGSPTNPGIYYAEGHLGLQNGTGYGILLVKGTANHDKAVSLNGGYSWEGLVIVLGTGIPSLSGSGNKVYGALFAANTIGETSKLYMNGGGDAYYSSQALCRVEKLFGTPKLIAWHEMMQ